MAAAGPPIPHTPTDEHVRDGAELARGAVVNTLAMLASNLRGIFTFLVARLLGRATLGVFTIAWNLVDLISKGAIFGFDDSVTTFVARAEAMGDRAGSRRTYATALKVSLALGALSTAVGVVAISGFGWRFGQRPEVGAALLILLWALPAMAIYKVSIAASRGMRVMRHALYSRGFTESIGTTVAFLIAVAVGARESAPAIAALAATVAAAGVAVCLAEPLFRYSSRRTPAAPDAAASPVRATALIGFSAPIAGYALLNSLIVNLDIVMLGWFVDRAPGVTLATVGVYAVAVDIAGGLRKVNQSFNPIFVPVVAAMAAGGERARAATTYARLARWMLAVLLPLIAIMTLGGGALLAIYGPAFRTGELWLAVVAVACATNAFVSLAEVVLMVERPRLNLLNSSITATVAVAANLWLISRFGITGAAFGILLPYVLQGILRGAELRYLFGWRSRWRELVHPCVAGAGAAAPAVVFRLAVEGIPGQLGAVAVFLLGYAAIWWRLGLDAADRAIVNELLGRAPSP